ncbi:hypothetical protein [Coleofasciculus sp. A1-SPW-01]
MNPYLETPHRKLRR